jgi:hypothetical protein
VQLLNTLIPGFEEKANTAENIAAYCAPVSITFPHGFGLISLYVKLQTGANDARSDDTSRLKIVVAEWLNSRTPSSSTSYTRLTAKGKDERGINHDITGRLLCPIDYEWDDA